MPRVGCKAGCRRLTTVPNYPLSTCRWSAKMPYKNSWYGPVYAELGLCNCFDIQEGHNYSFHENTWSELSHVRLKPTHIS